MIIKMEVSMNFDFINTLVSDSTVYDVDWGCMRYVCENKRREDFENAVSFLKDAGATVAQRCEIGDNSFATLRLADGDVALSYMNYNHTLNIITDPLNGRKAPELALSECEKLTSPKLTFVDLVSPIAVKEGNGLCMVYTLCDGSYIVYDGGFREDGENLVKILEENNVRNEKPRIAAWILTHSHGDHYYAMLEIAEKYADRITVEDFLVNARAKAYEYEQYEGYLGEQFLSHALPKFEGARLVKPHTGQRLYYRDAIVEILSTQEEILPSHFRWLNETVIVSRVYLGGQSIMMPADAELNIDAILPAMYGDALKSDILQETHHGFSGGSYIFYDLCRPEVAFWTCTPTSFEKYCHPRYNNGYNYYLKNMAKEHYCYGSGNVTLELPYKVK